MVPTARVFSPDQYRLLLCDSYLEAQIAMTEKKLCISKNAGIWKFCLTDKKNDIHCTCRTPEDRTTPAVYPITHFFPLSGIQKAEIRAHILCIFLYI